MATTAPELSVTVPVIVAVVVCATAVGIVTLLNARKAAMAANMTFRSKSVYFFIGVAPSD